MSLTIHAHHLGHIYSLFPQKRVQNYESREIALGIKTAPVSRGRLERYSTDFSAIHSPVQSYILVRQCQLFFSFVILLVMHN